MFSPTCDHKKLKINAQLCMQRLLILQKKKTENSVKTRREISEYLKSNKIDKARIKVEHIIREDYIVEAMSMIETYCEQLIERFGLFSYSKVLNDELKEAISTIIWVTPRMVSEVDELLVIRKQIEYKYGKEFVNRCLANADFNVNAKVMQKLNLSSPPCNLVEKYLVEIAASYEVDFKPDPYLLSGGNEGSSQGYTGQKNSAPLIDLGEPPEVPKVDCFPNYFDRQATDGINSTPYPAEHEYLNYKHNSFPDLPPKHNSDEDIAAAPPPYSSDNTKPDSSKKDTAPLDEFDDLSSRFNKLKDFT